MKAEKICDDFALHDSRIKVIHQKNTGVAAARNRGIENVTGKYIVFVDGDDWLEKDFIEYMVSLILQTDSDMAFSDNCFTTRDRIQIKKDRPEILEPDEAASRFLYPYVYIGCWNKIYKTDFIKSNGLKFPNTISGEGMQFIVYAAQKASRIGLGHRKVYNYRMNNRNSATTKYDLNIGLKAQDSINAIKKNITLKSRKLMNACDWHIWKNYGYVLFLIVATDSKEEHNELYNECRRNLLVRLPSVLLKSRVHLKTKLGMLYAGLFPLSWAKRRLKHELNALKSDLME